MNSSDINPISPQTPPPIVPEAAPQATPNIKTAAAGYQVFTQLHEILGEVLNAGKKAAAAAAPTAVKPTTASYNPQIADDLQVLGILAELDMIFTSPHYDAEADKMVPQLVKQLEALKPDCSSDIRNLVSQMQQSLNYPKGYNSIWQGDLGEVSQWMNNHQLGIVQIFQSGANDPTDPTASQALFGFIMIACDMMSNPVEGPKFDKSFFGNVVDIGGVKSKFANFLTPILSSLVYLQNYSNGQENWKNYNETMTAIANMLPQPTASEPNYKLAYYTGDPTSTPPLPGLWTAYQSLNYGTPPPFFRPNMNADGAAVWWLQVYAFPFFR